MTRVILDIFASAFGLNINPGKCLLLPIECNLHGTACIMNFFPGRLQPFPCKYLGIPLSLRKWTKGDLQPLVDRVAVALPTWKAG